MPPHDLAEARSLRYHLRTMAFFELYLAIIALLVTNSTMTLCFVCYALFRHRSAFWLSLYIAGLSWFALSGLVFRIGSFLQDGSSILGPMGLRLLFQALGGVFCAHALPRFLLAAFGASPRARSYRLLDVATVYIAVLYAVRVATGWNDISEIEAFPAIILRVSFLTLIGGALALTLIFQSRLPDRSLYKTVIAQIGAMLLLLPLVIIEDLGLLRIATFPHLAGQLFVMATSISAALHARRSLMRPRYVVDNALSAYFVERFRISEREAEVVTGLLKGLGNNEIADQLFISARTVETHLYNVYRKAGVKNRLQLYNLLRSDA